MSASAGLSRRSTILSACRELKTSDGGLEDGRLGTRRGAAMATGGNPLKTAFELMNGPQNRLLFAIGL
jgi:hypothetical protein